MGQIERSPQVSALQEHKLTERSPQVSAFQERKLQEATTVVLCKPV